MVGHLERHLFVCRNTFCHYYLYHGMAKYIKTGLRKCKIKPNNNEIYSSNIISLDFYFRYFSCFRIIFFLNHVNCIKWRFWKFLAAIAVMSKNSNRIVYLKMKCWPIAIPAHDCLQCAGAVYQNPSVSTQVSLKKEKGVVFCFSYQNSSVSMQVSLKKEGFIFHNSEYTYLINIITFITT